jgi:hypothetical protein
MFKSKPYFTCSYCTKILRDPILLPCDDLICREHLSGREVVKENRISCKECSEEFEVTCDQFRSKKTLKKLIESQSYLNEEESSLKLDIEVSIRKFFEFFDEFHQKKTKFESDVFEQFHEIRFQIDEHREELKEKIDVIALAMIDTTKKFEEIYLKNLREHFSTSDEARSLENEKIF